MLQIPLNYIARPVLGANDHSGSLHVVSIVHGTAFPVGGALHLTAGAGAVGLHNAVVVARWPRLDLAALMVLGLTTRAIQWRAGPLDLLAPVRSVGYPWGLEVGQYTRQRIMYMRAFAGHVVSSYRANDIPYLPGDPLIYELSFTAHLGLSGAALLTDNNEIAGCVVRNRTTPPAEGDEMSLGLAIQSSEVLALQLDDGSSIRDLVLKCGGSVR